MSDLGETFSPIANRPHRCEWCWQPIEKGEKHKHYSGMWDNEWQNWRMHDECYADYAYDGCGEFTPGCGEPPERLRKKVGQHGG